MNQATVSPQLGLIPVLEATERTVSPLTLVLMLMSQVSPQASPGLEESFADFALIFVIKNSRVILI